MIRTRSDGGRRRPAVFGLAAAGLIVVGAACGAEPAPSGPVVFEVRPAAGEVGASVVVLGEGFGATQGVSRVSFGGVHAAVSSWADDRVEVTVPERPTGETVLVVSRDGAHGAPVPFTVLP